MTNEGVAGFLRRHFTTAPASRTREQVVEFVVEELLHKCLRKGSRDNMTVAIVAMADLEQLQKYPPSSDSTEDDSSEETDDALPSYSMPEPEDVDNASAPGRALNRSSVPSLGQTLPRPSENRRFSHDVVLSGRVPSARTQLQDVAKQARQVLEWKETAAANRHDDQNQDSGFRPKYGRRSGRKTSGDAVEPGSEGVGALDPSPNSSDSDSNHYRTLPSTFTSRRRDVSKTPKHVRGGTNVDLRFVDDQLFSEQLQQAIGSDSLPSLDPSHISPVTGPETPNEGESTNRQDENNVTPVRLNMSRIFEGFSSPTEQKDVSFGVDPHIRPRDRLRKTGLQVAATPVIEGTPSPTDQPSQSRFDAACVGGEHLDFENYPPRRFSAPMGGAPSHQVADNYSTISASDDSITYHAGAEARRPTPDLPLTDTATSTSARAVLSGAGGRRGSDASTTGFGKSWGWAGDDESTKRESINLTPPGPVSQGQVSPLDPAGGREDPPVSHFVSKTDSVSVNAPSPLRIVVTDTRATPVMNTSPVASPSETSYFEYSEPKDQTETPLLASTTAPESKEPTKVPRRLRVGGSAPPRPARITDPDRSDERAGPLPPTTFTPSLFSPKTKTLEMPSWGAANDQTTVPRKELQVYIPVPGSDSDTSPDEGNDDARPRRAVVKAGRRAGQIRTTMYPAALSAQSPKGNGKGFSIPPKAVPLSDGQVVNEVRPRRRRVDHPSPYAAPPVAVIPARKQALGINPSRAPGSRASPKGESFAILGEELKGEPRKARIPSAGARRNIDKSRAIAERYGLLPKDIQRPVRRPPRIGSKTPDAGVPLDPNAAMAQASKARVGRDLFHNTLTPNEFDKMMHQ